VSAQPVQVEVQPLLSTHLDQVEAIERRSYPTPWSHTMFVSELTKPTSICLGAFDAEAGALIGYVIASRYVDAWHVMNVCVDPEFQGNRIAELLLQRLFEITDREGQRGFTLEVRVSNTRAIRLYERLGFVSRGVRRAYYTDNREDAYVMWREDLEEDAAP
jgi:ribosomal-protein-alanine N-acetyltransferase